VHLARAVAGSGWGRHYCDSSLMNKTWVKTTLSFITFRTETITVQHQNKGPVPIPFKASTTLAISPNLIANTFPLRPKIDAGILATATHQDLGEIRVLGDRTWLLCHTLFHFLNFPFMLFLRFLSAHLDWLSEPITLNLVRHSPSCSVRSTFASR
jgi:hypothetical protein